MLIFYIILISHLSDCDQRAYCESDYLHQQEHLRY